jgi:serine/threonine protein phosphatase PrpC
MEALKALRKAAGLGGYAELARRAAFNRFQNAIRKGQISQTELSALIANRAILKALDPTFAPLARLSALERLKVKITTVSLTETERFAIRALTAHEDANISRTAREIDQALPPLELEAAERKTLITPPATKQEILDDFERIGNDLTKLGRGIETFKASLSDRTEVQDKGSRLVALLKILLPFINWGEPVRAAVGTVSNMFDQVKQRADLVQKQYQKLCEIKERLVGDWNLVQSRVDGELAKFNEYRSLAASSMRLKNRPDTQARLMSEEQAERIYNERRGGIQEKVDAKETEVSGLKTEADYSLPEAPQKAEEVKLEVPASLVENYAKLSSDLAEIEKDYREMLLDIKVYVEELAQARKQGEDVQSEIGEIRERLTMIRAAVKALKESKLSYFDSEVEDLTQIQDAEIATGLKGLEERILEIGQRYRDIVTPDHSKYITEADDVSFRIKQALTDLETGKDIVEINAALEFLRRVNLKDRSKDLETKIMKAAASLEALLRAVETPLDLEPKIAVEEEIALQKMPAPSKAPLALPAPPKAAPVPPMPVIATIIMTQTDHGEHAISGGYAVTDIGFPNPHRPKNQDVFGAKVLPDGRRRRAYVVVDGMGGMMNGEIAAEIAVNSILFHLEKGLSPEIAIRLANKAIFDAIQQDMKLYGMAATFVLVIDDPVNKRLDIYQGGDARVKNITRDDAHLLTRDQNQAWFMAEEFAKRGKLKFNPNPPVSEEDLAVFDKALSDHVIGGSNVQSGGLGLRQDSVEIRWTTVEYDESGPQGALLMYSDGPRTDALLEAQISDIVRSSSNPQEAVTRIIARTKGACAKVKELLLRSGKKEEEIRIGDNITAAAIVIPALKLETLRHEVAFVIEKGKEISVPEGTEFPVPRWSRIDTGGVSGPEEVKPEELPEEIGEADVEPIPSRPPVPGTILAGKEFAAVPALALFSKTALEISGGKEGKFSSSRMRIAGVTSQGARRDEGDINQDSILILPEGEGFAMADGAGGMAGGEKASAAVVRAVLNNRGKPALEVFAQAQNRINKVLGVVEYIQDPGTGAMAPNGPVGGSTFSLVRRIADNKMQIAWRGNSRVYRLRKGQIELLTLDQHNASIEYLEQHKELDPSRGIPADKLKEYYEFVNNFAGDDITYALHNVKGEEPAYWVYHTIDRVVEVQKGDVVFALCDGFNCLPFDKFRAIVTSGKDLPLIVEELYREARPNATDNLSAIFMQIKTQGAIMQGLRRLGKIIKTIYYWPGKLQTRFVNFIKDSWKRLTTRKEKKPAAPTSPVAPPPAPEPVKGERDLPLVIIDESAGGPAPAGGPPPMPEVHAFSESLVISTDYVVVLKRRLRKDITAKITIPKDGFDRALAETLIRTLSPAAKPEFEVILSSNMSFDMLAQPRMLQDIREQISWRWKKAGKMYLILVNYQVNAYHSRVGVKVYFDQLPEDDEIRKSFEY